MVNRGRGRGSPTYLFEINPEHLGKDLLLGRLGISQHQDAEFWTWCEEFGWRGKGLCKVAFVGHGMKQLAIYCLYFFVDYSYFNPTSFKAISHQMQSSFYARAYYLFW